MTGIHWRSLCRDHSVLESNSLGNCSAIRAWHACLLCSNQFLKSIQILMLQIWLTTQVLSNDSIELIFSQTCLALGHEVVAYHPHYHILSNIGRL